MRLIIAIVDTLANDITGTLTIHRNEVTALRMWDDIMRMENSQVRMHANDYELQIIGQLDDETIEIIPQKKTLMTGAQWLAAQPTTQGSN